TLLRQLLGDGYGEVIRRAMAHKTIPELTPEGLSAFLKLEGKPDSYRDLREKLQGLGKLFEADHLLEKRFLKSPRVTDYLDPDDIFAYAVPKNELVAKQLADLLQTSTDLVPYVHAEKTQMLRRLIPYGLED